MKTYDLNIINQYVADGKISKQVHPILPLSIYKYTLQTQVTNDWDEITKAARGLVLDDQGVAWSNPIPKFLNIEQIDPSEIPNLPYEITDKVDGSCIEVFWYKGQLVVCTLGSFTSDQAKIASDILFHWKTFHQAVNDDIEQFFNLNKTYIFELIAPENRIVLDYGADRKLVLITVRDNDTGEETLPTNLSFTTVDKYTTTIEELMLEKTRPDFINKEGFVVKFSNGFRVKVKYEEYFRLHKVMTGVNEKMVWEYLKDGLAIPLDNVPDEFFKFVNDIRQKLITEYQNFEISSQVAFRCINKPGMSRKEFALEALKVKPYSSVLFKMFEGKDYSQLIWKHIEPKSVSNHFNLFKKEQQ